MGNRKSGKELRKEYNSKVKSLEAFEARIKDRAEVLMTKYPDAIIGKISTAKFYTDNFSINDLNPISCLGIIEKIEQHIADLHPHKQMDMFDTSLTLDGKRIVNSEIIVIPKHEIVGERVIVNGKTGETYTRKKDV